MTPAQTLHTAWLFSHSEPSLDAEAGLTLGLNGEVALTSGDRAIRQAIFLLLSTSPGERVMRPDYGCELYRLVFMPNDETTAGLAIHYVRQALQRWEPRIEILELDAGRNPDRAECLDVMLVYRVRANLNVAELRFPVELTGA